jgi:Signal transduction histidine kinase
MKAHLKFIVAFSMLLSVAFGSSAADTLNFASDTTRRVVIYNSYSKRIAWASTLDGIVRDSLKARYPWLTIAHGFADCDRAKTRIIPMIHIRSSAFSYRNLSSDEFPECYNGFFKSENQPICNIFIGEESWNVYRYMRFMNHMNDSGSAHEVPEVILSDVDSVSNIYDPFDHPMTGYYNPIQIEKSRHLLAEDGKGEAYSHEPMSFVNLKLPLKENLDLIFAMFPDTREIVFLDSKYPAVHYVWNGLQAAMKEEGYSSRASVWQMSVSLTNSNAIFDSISVSHPGRVYLSYAFSWSRDFSSFSQEKMDSVLNIKGGNPIFYLKSHTLLHNREIGGFFRSEDEAVSLAVDCAAQYIDGKSDDRSLELKGGSYVFNKTALNYYKVPASSYVYKNAIYVNRQSSFFKTYKVEVMEALFFLIMMAAGISVYKRYRANNRKINRISEKYKSLFEEMSFLFNNANFMLSIYSSDGRSNYSESSDMPVDINLSGLLSKRSESRFDAGESYSSDGILNGIPSHVVVNRFKNVDGSSGYIAAVSNLEEFRSESLKVMDMEGLIDFATSSLDIGMACFNPCDGYAYANDVWFQYTGDEKTHSDTFVPDYHTFSPADRADVTDDMEKRFKSPMPPFSSNLVLVYPDGSSHYVSLYIFSIKSEKESCESILQLILNNDRIRNDESDLSKAEELAKQAEKDRTSFLNNVSHEIRTPLNAIVGFSNILAAEEPVAEDEKIMMIDSIKSNKEQLFKLISDVLDISKFEAGSYKFNYKVIDLNESFNNYLYEIKRQCKTPDIRALCGKHSGSPLFRTDGVCLNKIYMNLISNACKFTSSGGISIGYTERPDSYSFYIKDTGCGIKESDIQRIFKSFEKIDSFTPGFGLGLSLTKAIVENMGGKISIISEVNVGTTVWFSLPKQEIKPFTGDEANSDLIG